MTRPPFRPLLRATEANNSIRAGWRTVLIAGLSTGVPFLSGCTAKLTGTPVGENGQGQGPGQQSEQLCTSQPQVMPQRLVRLTNAQLQNGIGALLGMPALADIDLEDPRDREFQALRYEGDLINIELLRKTVDMADRASMALDDRYEEVTSCTPGDDACARTFIADFAHDAYRRPLVAGELDSILQLYEENLARFAEHSTTNGVTEAVRYAIEGILASPAVVYRTEFGTPTGEGDVRRLTPFEHASLLSYFLSDGPPDATLLTAAESGALDTETGLREQIARLLQEPNVRENIWRVVLAYYELKTIESTIKDGEVYPEFTVGMRNSMYEETSRFIHEVLETGTVNDLITSKRTYVNDILANLYDIPYTGTGSDDFVEVDLSGTDRSGLLTQASILSMRARTNDTSVVSRGLYVNSNVLCIERPPQPPAAAASAIEAQLSNNTLTERDRADERAVTQPCGGCHAAFDPYGITLETFDAIGQSRTEYPGVGPIDTSTTLPQSIGGGEISSVSELAQIVAENGTFTKCVTTNMTKYALSDALGLLHRNDCGLRETHDRFLESPGTFWDLLLEVAASETLALRVPEAATADSTTPSSATADSPMPETTP